MATIHFVLQGKGGVGKSMIALFLYQALEQLGNEVIAFDTDPVNATLSAYKDIKTIRLDLLKTDDVIDPRKFDELLELLAESPEERHIIIDNGASSFINLAAYMKDSNMLSTLYEDFGHTVYFHTVITGGQGIGDTIEGFVNLSANFPDTPLIVWLNPYFGAVELEGKKFIETKWFKEYGQNIHTIIELPVGNRDLIGKDLEQLFVKKMSFEKGINSTFSIATRSRLKKYWKQILSYVEQANIC